MATLRCLHHPRVVALGKTKMSSPMPYSEEPSDLELVSPSGSTSSPAGSNSPPDDDELRMNSDSSVFSSDEVPQIHLEPDNNDDNGPISQTARMVSRAVGALHVGLSRKMDRKFRKMDRKWDKKFDAVEIEVRDVKLELKDVKVDVSDLKVEMANIRAHRHNAGVEMPFERIHDISRAILDTAGTAGQASLPESVMPKRLDAWWYALRHSENRVERLAEILMFFDSDWFAQYGIDGIHQDELGAMKQVARMFGLNWHAIKKTMEARDEQLEQDAVKVREAQEWAAKRPQLEAEVRALTTRFIQNRKRRNSGSDSIIDGPCKYQRLPGTPVVRLGRHPTGLFAGMRQLPPRDFCDPAAWLYDTGPATGSGRLSWRAPRSDDTPPPRLKDRAKPFPSLHTAGSGDQSTKSEQGLQGDHAAPASGRWTYSSLDPTSAEAPTREQEGTTREPSIRTKSDFAGSSYKRDDGASVRSRESGRQAPQHKGSSTSDSASKRIRHSHGSSSTIRASTGERDRALALARSRR
ncbi:hypothetical protein KVT40_002683 [Elsinoe batatas]|uniref:Uncharacterized protein n=1 Tax=Elsinoe batatas TaxID=2601811 RepID=A0A8K0L626_9PEZI|nr:hypothetical protein KVT40_002683 [Elsinoe batatas]